MEFFEEKLSVKSIFREEILSLLDNKIFLKKILKEILLQNLLMKIKIEDSIKNDFINKFMKKNNINSLDYLKEYLLKIKVSKKDFENGLLRETMINNLAFELSSEKVIYEFYMKQRNKYDVATYYLLRFKEKSLALDCYFQIQSEGKAIKEIYDNYCIKVDLKSGPKVGPSLISKMHPDLGNKLKNMNPGELSEPFFINDIWLITKLEEKSLLIYDDQLKSNIARQLLYVRIDQIAESLIAEYELEKNK